MKTIPEADRMVCQLSYKCGCTRSGMEGELPQLCPVHGEPPFKVTFVPQRGDGNQ